MNCVASLWNERAKPLEFIGWDSTRPILTLPPTRHSCPELWHIPPMAVNFGFGKVAIVGQVRGDVEAIVFRVG